MRKEIITADLLARVQWGVKCEIDDSGDYTLGLKHLISAEKSHHEIKPILFSSLTEPITVAGYNDGLPFVPLVEAAKSMGIKFVRYSVNGNSIDFVLAKEYVRENTKTRELRKARFWFDSHSSYGFCMAVEGCRTPFLKQLVGIEFFQKYHINYRLLPGEYIEATNEYS